MKVCFLRHGPAAPSGTPGIAEPDRPLTAEGRKKTRRALQGLKRLNLGIDEILTSPLPRALQTAEILADVLGGIRPAVDERLLPEVPAGRLLGLLKDVKGEVPLLVGHEPNLTAALALLVGAGRPDAHLLKKAGLAVVEVGKLTARPAGTLHLLLTPHALRLL